MLDIEIDGHQTQVPPGSTIMDAAQKLGVYIPHFCYHKKLSIAANCRMCLVQVEKAPKPLPACATPVTNGMKVFTHSELAIEAQKGVMEFLLINHPLDCPICDQGGECQLQDLAVGYGGSKSRYEEEKRVVFHKNVGPLISMQEMSRCIHCTRCVRFGQEIAGVMELGMAHRNMHSEIQTFVGRAIESELSGNMIDLCPVGALTSKPFRYAARSWELSRRRSVSPHDSIGSNLNVQVKGNQVLRVLPAENEDVNECWISDRDRFSYEGLNSPERVTKPLVRVDGALREVDWNVALDYVAHGLRDIVRTYGADSIAALGSPTSTLEELYLLQKMMRGIGSGNVDFRGRQRAFANDSFRMGAPWLGLRLSEIAQLDAVLVVGAFLRKDAPLLAQRIRQAAKKGCEVSSIAVTGDDDAIGYKARVVTAPGDLANLLARLVKSVALLKGGAVPEYLLNIDVDIEANNIAQSLVNSANTAIFLGTVVEQIENGDDVHFLINELSRILGARFGFVGAGANSVGGYVASAVPSGLNAYEMFKSQLKAYIFMGVEPELDCHNPLMVKSALASASLKVALTSFVTPALQNSMDVILPVSPFTETSGTFVNCEGRVQSFKGVTSPAGDSRPAWKVLRVLANLLDLGGFNYDSSTAVLAEVPGIQDGFVTKLSNELNGGASLRGCLASSPLRGVQRIADVPIYFSDSLVRQASGLQRTNAACSPVARLNAYTRDCLELGSALRIKVSQGGPESLFNVVVDENVPNNCVCISAAHADCANLGDMFGMLSVELHND